MHRPVKVRYEDHSFFIVIPKEVFQKTGLKKGDWLILEPFPGGFTAKKIEEVGHGGGKEDSAGSN